MFRKYLLKFVFEFLNQKVLTIAHPQLRQFAKQIVSDCEAFAELMLTHDLTDAATAQKVYEAQVPYVSATPIHLLQNRTFADTLYRPHVPKEKADVPKDFDDLPTPRKRKGVQKETEIPRI